MQAKITALKKSAGKKNKKEVHAEIEKLEKDLEAKHLDELKNLKINDEPNPNINNDQPESEPETNDQKPAQRVSKAQKRREKKNKEERDRQAQIEEEEKLNLDGPRNIESTKIKEILESRQLSIFPISADGDCLYNSVAHQLKMTGRSSMNVDELRNITADYIKSNKDTLIPYMTNPDTDQCLNDEEFEEYCEKIKNSKCWGGQIEIKALSNALKVPIEVLQASGPPTVQTQESYKKPNLILTYHRHFVSLGEHYNSTQPLIISEED